MSQSAMEKRADKSARLVSFPSDSRGVLPQKAVGHPVNGQWVGQVQ